LSPHTRSALAAKKANGSVLGNPRNLDTAGHQGRMAQQNEAARFSANIILLIRSI
jgi:hypothetical protein